MSDSSRPHGLQPTRLLRPWDFPGKSTGVGCHCLLQGSFQTGESWPSVLECCVCVCVCVCVFNELFLHLLLCLMKIHHLEAGYGDWPSDFLLPLSASLSFCSIFWAFWSTLSSKPVISKVLHCCCPCLLCPFLCFILLISYLISVKILMTVFLFYFILGWFWSLWIH